jgi:hypothetical protein
MDFKASLKRREDRIVASGSTVQPVPVIVGKDINNITASYVCLNNVTYKVQSPLSAVDIAFKSYHIFQTKYPEEAEHVWTLIQLGIYKLETPFDKHFTSVNTFISELGLN